MWVCVALVTLYDGSVLVEVVAVFVVWVIFVGPRMGLRVRSWFSFCGLAAAGDVGLVLL